MTKERRYLLAFFLVLLGACNFEKDRAMDTGVLPVELRCEYRRNPLGVDVREPRLSWVLESVSLDQRNQRQTAYRVLVASTPGLLSKDRGDLWDSSKVDSNQTLHVTYAGHPLQSKMSCYWKVRVWDESSRESPWSDIGHWSMGLLHGGDWGAKWIGNDRPVVTREDEEQAYAAANSGYLSTARSPLAPK